MKKLANGTNIHYLWKAIVDHVSSAISGKLNKLSSSTDNAIVRFDGTSGNIQNSGVTINDSNHLTAAKLITSGGTSSQFVKGDGSLDSTSYVSSTNAVKNEDYLISNYVTLTNSIKGRIFDRNSQDTFFAANSRFIVTHKRYSSTDDSFIKNLSTDLFKGAFGSYGNTVLDGEYGILYIGNVAEDELSATTSNTNCIFTYPQGKIFLTFYTSMRCGEILEAKGWFRNDTTWRNLTVVANNTIVYEIQVPNVSYLKAIRIKYSGSNLGSEQKTSLSDVAYIRNRDDIVSRNLITKYPTAQTMYGNLTAPKFITSGGTSSQFVKGNGTLDSNTYLTSSSLSTYAPLASPALTGTPTAPTAVAGTNTTQIATTAFVQSAVPKDYQVDYSKTYLTFEALESGTFTFTGYSTNTVSYSIDDGKTWTSLASATASPTISAGDRIMWKASGLRIDGDVGIGTFSSTGNYNVSGNIMSLANGDDFIGVNTITAVQFRLLFNGSTKLINAENLILPATTLTNSCYRQLFQGCTGLITAPKLPATTLGINCYDYMFDGCTSLKTAPDIIASTFSSHCCRRMFYGCTSLNYIKCLATDISADYCTQNWVYDVASTGTFVKAASMSSWTTGTSGIPSGWTVRTESEMEHVTKGELDDLVGNIETLLASI